MRSTHVLLIVVALLSFAVPAFAQDAAELAGAGTSAVGIILRETATGCIAVICLLGVIYKDRQITKENLAHAAALAALNAANTEKLLALSVAHAADNAKAIELQQRVLRFLEKGSA